MKTTTLNNQELVIQARNENDYLQAIKLANMITNEFEGMADIVGQCKYELWVHIGFINMPYNAKEIRDTYNELKKAL